MTHREDFLELIGLPKDTKLSLQDISYITQIPTSALLRIYRRGYGAWKSNLSSVRLKSDFSKNPDIKKYPRSARLGPEQWAYARIYAFIMKSPTFYGPDSDIAKELGLLSP